MADKVHLAMLFAIESHRGHVRKYTGEPYWKHLAEVAAITQTASRATPEMIMAAWLHDTIEDTGVTFERLRQMFGLEVAELVHGLTDVSMPHDGNRAQRKALDREHVARGDYRVQTIKLADLISNTSSIVQNDPAFAWVYLNEKRQLLEVLDKGDEALQVMARQILIDSELELFNLQNC